MVGKLFIDYADNLDKSVDSMYKQVIQVKTSVEIAVEETDIIALPGLDKCLSANSKFGTSTRILIINDD